MRVLGIDPGTGSMDLLLIDDEDLTVLFEEAVPRPEVTRDPGTIARIIERLDSEHGLDAVAAPSGYGVPPGLEGEDLRRAICEATFVNKRDAGGGHQIHGLRWIMEWLAGSGLRVYFTPGVVQLPTVPEWRKLNRIDMGTADKVFTVAAALARESMIGDPASSRLIVVEAGYAYTAAIAVDRGVIVDGIGGTSGCPGFLGAGCLDAEVAYVMAEVEPGFPRARLFEGGAHVFAGTRSVEEFARLLAARHPGAMNAARLLAESVGKMVASLAYVLGGADRVYLSGRLTRVPILAGMIAGEARRAAGAPVEKPLRLGSKTKEGATGAALLASGYAGGRFRWIVERLRLMEAAGSIFDNIRIDDIAVKAKNAFCPRLRG